MGRKKIIIKPILDPKLRNVDLLFYHSHFTFLDNVQ